MSWARRLDYSGGAIRTDQSWVGNWLRIDRTNTMGVDVTLTGTGSPTGTFGFDVSNDPNANLQNINSGGSDGNLIQPPTALTLDSTMVTNPSGTTANINFLLQLDGSPRAKWGRFKYSAASGGANSPLMTITVEQEGRL